MKKRPLACLLVLCLLATFLPVTAGAAEVEPPVTAATSVEIYEVSPSAKPVVLNGDTPYYVGGKAAAAGEDGTAPQGWTAHLEPAKDGADATLTLNGLTIKDGYVYVEGDVNVALENESTITYETLPELSEGLSTAVSALRVSGNLTISGTGTLSATVVENDNSAFWGSYGVLASQITVTGGTVNGTANFTGGYGINSQLINVTGGTVTGTANAYGGCGVWALGLINVSGDGKVTGNGVREGVSCGKITVTGGTLTGTANADGGFGVRGDTLTGGEEPGTGSANVPTGYGVWGNTLTVSGGTVTGTSNAEGGCGVLGNTLTVSGGTVTGTSNAEGGCGVLGGTVTVTGGAVTGEAGGDRGSGVVGVTTTVTGGTVTGSGGNEGYGVGGETITVNGGTVTGIGGANGTGILGKRIAVLDGTLQGESDNAEKTYYGVESYYDADETDQGLGIVVSGGRFIAKGGWCIASYAPDPDNEGKYIRTPYPIRVTADSYIYKLAGGAEQNGPREWTVEDGEQDVEIVCTKPEPTPPSSYDPPVNNTTTTTTKNEDGSTTTKTENKTTGTVTETTKKPDGSQVKVETKKDGTVTTTETDAAGNKTETVAKSDGSSVTKVERKDGTTATVNTDAEGKVEAEVSLPKEVVAAAQESGSAIALPIPEVKTAASTAAAPAVTVKTGSETPVKVLIPTVESKPGTVAILVKADGTEEIIKTSVSTGDGLAVALPDGATVKIVDNSKHFADMPADNWATDAVNFSSARELFSGTAPDTFSPDAPMTRAMLVTVLARFDGADTSGGSTWYEQGVDWAVSKGISDGSNINGNVSREQLAVMLWRYAGSPAPAGDLSGFQDGDAVSGYALDAMRWAVEKGIVSGFGDGQLGPQGQATRVQVAKMLMNFISAQ